MRLVLVNKDDLCTYTMIAKMEENIEFCNKVLNELLEPIKHYFAELYNVGLSVSKEYFNSIEISVEVDYFDFINLMELTTLLTSNNTRKIFETIQKDLKENKEEVSILNVSKEYIDYLVTRCLQTDDITDFLKSFKNLLQGRKDNEEHP